ncbi:hypothetical protein ACYOEI_20165 [Singulisphaera rosea]
MLGPFDDLLLKTASDGASATVDVYPNRNAGDLDQIMDAWYRERQGHIETGLFLDQARQLLLRIISEGEITLANKRRAKRLLSAMSEARITEARKEA